jgi:hypothetical protein
MLNKIFLILSISFMFIFTMQCQKYDYKIVDNRYVINDLDEYLKVFKKALKEKDNDTLLKLFWKGRAIIYDDKNFKGSNHDNETILKTGFDYNLCLRVINNKVELTGNAKKMQAYIPPYKRTVEEEYTVMLEKWGNEGWYFVGLYYIPYESPSVKNTEKKPKEYLPKNDNLNLMEKPELKSKVVKVLKKYYVLYALEKGKNETINGVKGNWIKVQTDDGFIGWVFDGDVNELK